MGLNAQYLHTVIVLLWQIYWAANYLCRCLFP